jgi:hypothetical protein
MGTKKTLVIDVIKVLAPTWTMILGYLVGIVITSTKGQLLFVIYLFTAAGVLWSYPLYRHRFPFVMAVWLAYPFLLLALTGLVWIMTWLVRLATPTILALRCGSGSL